MARIGRVAAWLGGALAVAGAGAALYYWREASVETPDHVRYDGDGDFEIRDYPPLLVATTRDAGLRDSAISRSFERLAGYIFAKDRPGEKIAMTAPVLQDADASLWRTRFVLPRRWTTETLPQPSPGVTIEELPSRRMAVVRFSGAADDLMLDDQEQRLRAWLQGRGIEPTGPREYAFYNSPFVPPALRRNEVLLPVAR